MNILITGSRGFIGASLIDFFLKKNYKIKALSRDKGQSDDNLQFISFDWDFNDDFLNNFSNVDVVIHTAGMNAIDSNNNPHAALHFNGLKTMELLQGCLKKGVKKIIYFSTAHVYTDNFTNKYITEENCVTNFQPYATSHRSGEDSIIYADKKEYIEGYVIRLSNSFGYTNIYNKNAWNLIVNNFCLQAVKEKKIDILSNTNQIWNFISIRNICNCLEFIINYKRPINYFDIFDNSIFNLGSNISCSITDLAELVSNRYEKIFNQKIFINKNNLDCERIISFSYSQKKINKLGFHTNNDFIEEIDLILTKLNPDEQD